MFQPLELFGHQDSPVIYRYKHFLLYITLSTRSPKGDTLLSLGAEW